MEIIPDSEPSSPRMESEERTQTDETTKPEEQEVEIQLCAEVSSVSLDEYEGIHFRNYDQDNSSRTSRGDEEGMEIDNSPPPSPMPVDREVHIEDSTETAEPSIRVKDMTPDASAVEMEVSFDPGAIPVNEFYGSNPGPSRTYSQRRSRVSAPGKLEGGPNGGDSGGNIETTPLKT